jgi:hypothetical protein
VQVDRTGRSDEKEETMNGRLSKWLGTTGAVVAIVLAGAAAAQAGGRPVGMSAQEWKAEQIRGEGLDKLYGGGAPEGMTPAEYRAELIRGEALDKLYGGGAPEGMTPAQYRAELIRGDGLNKLYGLGEYAGTVTSTPAQPSVSRQAQSVASGGFDWGDAGIGAGAGIGFVLLAAGIGVATRQTRRPRLTTTG